MNLICIWFKSCILIFLRGNFLGVFKKYQNAVLYIIKFYIHYVQIQLKSYILCPENLSKMSSLLFVIFIINAFILTRLTSGMRITVRIQESFSMFLSIAANHKIIKDVHHLLCFVFKGMKTLVLEKCFNILAPKQYQWYFQSLNTNRLLGVDKTNKTTDWFEYIVY